MLRQHKNFLSFAMGLLFTVLSFVAHAQTIDELLHQPNNPIAGNPKGTITVVDFFDYQCEHCIKMAPVLNAIIKANPNVRIVFKDFPIMGPMSQFAAQAAIAANMQGKYYEFNHALMTVNQPLTQELVFEVAKSVGLNMARLKKDINSPTVAHQLEANMKLAKSLKLYATPTYFIGKTDTTNEAELMSLLGSMSQAEFQNAINNVK
ncbi:MAG: DsbA family protein [Gammaproteobacteria bacterium]|nr:MAG: DsbA family protein [Gammaproteobacteria bacterium]